MTAIENQSQVLQGIAEATNGSSPHRPAVASVALDNQHDTKNDLESISRKDVSWTPITASDKILEWVVFPEDKLASTPPISVYEAYEAIELGSGKLNLVQ